MASEGTRFSNHFSTAGVCVPSRCSILTGKYPHETALWRFGANENTLPLCLRAAGYHTARFGFREENEFFIIRGDVDREAYARDVLGYDESEPHKKDSAELAADYICYREAYKSKAPLYVCIQFSDIHRPNEAPVDEETLAWTAPPRVLPDLPVTQGSLQDVASFEIRAHRADAAIGKILDYLCSSGLKNNTIVVFTSDHGLDLPRAKLTLYEAATRVAMIFWGPIPAGKVVERMGSHIDILPSLLDMAGVEKPEGISGLSFAPAFFGKPCAEHEYIIMEKSWESPLTPMRALRTRKYKYIRNYCPGYPIRIPPDWARKAGETAEKFYNTSVPYEQLYDLEKDPTEHTNLADDPSYSALLAGLSGTLSRRLEAGGDPVLHTETYMAFLKERFPDGVISKPEGKSI
jgi:hypothetical protein